MLAPGQLKPPHLSASVLLGVHAWVPWPGRFRSMSGQLSRESSASSLQVIVLNSVFSTSLPSLHLQPLCEEGVHMALPPDTHVSTSIWCLSRGLGSSLHLPLWIPASPPTFKSPIPIYSINSFPHYVYPFTWLLCFLILLMFIICPTGSTDFASCRASRL